MNVGGITESRLLVIGHRGASAYAPENTIASFDRAQSDGADGIEFDVRLARDEVPVVFHDDSFERTVGIYGNVESHSSTVISQFYAGEWFNERYPNRARSAYAWERVPTLAQVFERYGSLKLYVEMKCEDASRRARLAQAVVRLVREYGLAERVVVKSFEHDSLGEVKRLAPEIRTAALFGRSWPNPFVPARKILAGAEACGADEISLHRSLLRAATVREARRRGFEVLVWTVNSSVWLRRALALGLRAVFTDYPGSMRRYLFQKLIPADEARPEN
ncbi:MAG TPA: glycerophosphodiester phosphodiesterase [Pyrinomonadaceae bacterium]|nr:glycerophosphodiester phosphodiesterase [Pyrinomonadaceae bacterium]